MTSKRYICLLVLLICLKYYSAAAYYNRSVVLLHGLTFCAALGHGMSGTVSEMNE